METSEESRAYVQFLVPHALESQLAGFLAKLEAASPELGICDIQMSLTSLEEVFLNIAKKVRWHSIVAISEFCQRDSEESGRSSEVWVLLVLSAG